HYPQTRCTPSPAQSCRQSPIAWAAAQTQRGGAKGRRKGEAMARLERRIAEGYAKDPERADRVGFGRSSGSSRRGFLRGLAATSAALGAPIPFADCMPGGLLPLALAQDAKEDAPGSHWGRQKLRFPGKDGNLVVLRDDPLVAETPEQLLDDETTPTDRFFIRNNGRLPAAPEAG